MPFEALDPGHKHVGVAHSEAVPDLDASYWFVVRLKRTSW